MKTMQAIMPLPLVALCCLFICARLIDFYGPIPLLQGKKLEYLAVYGRTSMCS